MRKRALVVAACLVIVLIPLLILLVGRRSNSPTYQAWANCKQGSWVTTRRQNGDEVEERKVVLLSVSSAQVVVRVTRRSTAGETTEDQSHPSRIDPAELEKAPKPTSERTEEIEVGGRRVRCRRMEWRDNRPGSQTVHVSWYSDEIPGGLAKLVAGPEGAPTFVQVAVGWEKK